MAKQGKHIPGHANFISGRSIFSHSDPQSLLTHFAGTGTRVRGTAGQAGYVERVNFGQSIGTWIDEAGNQAETTWGLIHYSNRGAHIVPARPGGF
jgi:hypothetical protein